MESYANQYEAEVKLKSSHRLQVSLQYKPLLIICCLAFSLEKDKMELSKTEQPIKPQITNSVIKITDKTGLDKLGLAW